MAKAKDKKEEKKVEVEEPARDVVEAVKQIEVPKAEEPKAEEEKPVEAPVAEMAMPENLPMYKIKKEWRGSFRGNVTRFAEGKLINPRGYGGMPGIEGMRKLGIELEEVK